MFSLVGIVVVFAAVLGGYLLERGEIALLLQPAEFIIIWGAAAGSLVIATPPAVIRRILTGVRRVFAKPRFDQALYLDTLRLLNGLFQKARRQGMMGIEEDVEAPEKSALFHRHKLFNQDRRAVDFICDTLRVAITGGVPPFDIDQMVDADLEVHDDHNHQPVQSLTTVADALPGLGIVAAVLGIVISMSSLGGPPEQVGHKVAAALVGTFLGVLTSYGLVAPLAAALNSIHEAEAAYFRVLKTAVVAFIKGHPPLISLEFARRSIPHEVRPTFALMEKECKAAST